MFIFNIWSDLSFTTNFNTIANHIIITDRLTVGRSNLILKWDNLSKGNWRFVHFRNHCKTLFLLQAPFKPSAHLVYDVFCAVQHATKYLKYFLFLSQHNLQAVMWTISWWYEVYSFRTKDGLLCFGIIICLPPARVSSVVDSADYLTVTIRNDMFQRQITNNCCYFVIYGSLQTTLHPLFRKKISQCAAQWFFLTCCVFTSNQFLLKVKQCSQLSSTIS